MHIADRLRFSCTVFVIVLSFMLHPGPAEAQNGRVQQLSGHLEPEDTIVYLVPDLSAGDSLYVYLAGTSGNLDPFVGLTDVSVDIDALGEEFIAEVDSAIARGRDPLEAIPDAKCRRSSRHRHIDG